MKNKLGKLTVIVGLAIGSLSLSSVVLAHQHCHRHHHHCAMKCCHMHHMTYGKICDWTPAMWSQGYPYPGHLDCERGMINTKPPVHCVWVSTHKHSHCGATGYKVCSY